MKFQTDSDRFLFPKHSIVLVYRGKICNFIRIEF